MCGGTASGRCPAWSSYPNLGMSLRTPRQHQGEHQRHVVDVILRKVPALSSSSSRRLSSRSMAVVELLVFEPHDGYMCIGHGLCRC